MLWRVALLVVAVAGVPTVARAQGSDSAICGLPTPDQARDLFDTLLRVRLEDMVMPADNTRVVLPVMPTLGELPPPSTEFVEALEASRERAERLAWEALTCEERIAALDLSETELITEAAACRSDDPCVVEQILRSVAEEYQLPLDLVFATAWRESNWTHWRGDNNEEVVVGGGVDYGLMQINIDGFGVSRLLQAIFDWEYVPADPLYNARVGAFLLADCRSHALRSLRDKPPEGVTATRTNVMKATYACYNGGYDEVFRPWDEDDRYHGHDVHFAADLSSVRDWLGEYEDAPMCSVLGGN